MNLPKKTWGIVLLSMSLLMTGCGESVAESETSQPASVQLANFPQFAAKDLAGDTVTNDIFARKKITVVNIWGTFCPPCIGEMPELGEWSRNMPEDAQLIGIICDANGENDTKTAGTAQKILKEAQADFVNLLPSKDLMQYLESVEAVPTTIFVDSAGNLIGTPVIGADVAQYKKRVAEYLHE